MKSNKGFTLVELIVVIAILAILAGIAIPAYSGYIKKANDAAVVTELDAIATAAQAANATAGEIQKINVTETTITVTGATATNYDKDFVLFYDGVTPITETTDVAGTFEFNTAFDWDNSSYATGATWQNGKWTAGIQ